MKSKRKGALDHPVHFDVSPELSRQLIDDVTLLLESNAGEPLFDYASKLWLTKCVDHGDALDAETRRSKAIDKWLTTELNNEVTNRRLADRSLDSNIIFGSVTVGDFLHKVTTLVGGMLPNPILSLIEGGFSGGATTSKTRRCGHPSIKFRDEADATPDALGMFLPLVGGTIWGDFLYHRWRPSIVRGNILFTVPKSNQIDRVACKEPDINVFLQKMLGNQLRRALRRTGIDLNDQSVNARLAQIGSIDGSLATIDLSSASDSVSTELVRRVLPARWFEVLDTTRSHFTSIDGDWHKNQMFSSMGNGFTFELESLLFLAISRATAWFTRVSGRISVYGDDIIVPTSLVDNLEEALAYCGFSLNRTKSFSSGPIRESCGAHWYSGIAITPFYLRRYIRNVSDLILFLNQLIKWGSQSFNVVDPRVEEVWEKYAGIIPSILHGGQDLGERYALVTGDRPRSRLKPVTRERTQAHFGGLVYWLHTAEFLGHKRPSFSTSQTTEQSEVYRVRVNNHAVNEAIPAFTRKFEQKVA